MASKNSVKKYIHNGIYHVYNRGVEKRNIFQDDQDYNVFLAYIRNYLTPKDINILQTIINNPESKWKERDNAKKQLQLKNYFQDIDLLGFSLLPYHFHLILRQNSLLMNRFMNSLGTRYSMYFNHKYRRVGVLFQDIYKAVLIESDEQLLQLSKYVHLNSFRWKRLNNLTNSQVFPSSLPYYLCGSAPNWLNITIIGEYFSSKSSHNNYSQFINEAIDYELIHNLAIDSDID